MAAATTAPVMERQWFIASRWQEYDGESRANLLRIIAVGAFYVVELIQFYVIAKGSADQLPFHQKATAIAVAWSMLALAVMLCLRSRIFPTGLKYCSTFGDLLLLTAIAALAAGPHSPLVLIYFVIIAVAALRFSLSLIWFSTVGSMICYWSLVGLADKTWFDPHHAVPPATQLITMLSLAMTGVVAGQVVRRVKGLAEEYAQRLAAAKAKA